MSTSCPLIPIQALLSSSHISDLCFPYCSVLHSPQGEILALIQDPTQVPLPWYQLMWCLFCGGLSFIALCYNNLSQNFLVKRNLTGGPRPRYLHLTTRGHLKNHDRPLSPICRDSDGQVWDGPLESILLKAPPGDSDAQPRLRTTSPIQPPCFTYGKTELQNCCMTCPRPRN